MTWKFARHLSTTWLNHQFCYSIITIRTSHLSNFQTETRPFCVLAVNHQMIAIIWHHFRMNLHVNAWIKCRDNCASESRLRDQPHLSDALMEFAVDCMQSLLDICRWQSTSAGAKTHRQLAGNRPIPFLARANDRYKPLPAQLIIKFNKFPLAVLVIQEKGKCTLRLEKEERSRRLKASLIEV